MYVFRWSLARYYCTKKFSDFWNIWNAISVFQKTVSLAWKQPHWKSSVIYLCEVISQTVYCLLCLWRVLQSLMTHWTVPSHRWNRPVYRYPRPDLWTWKLYLAQKHLQALWCWKRTSWLGITLIRMYTHERWWVTIRHAVSTTCTPTPYITESACQHTAMKAKMC